MEGLKEIAISILDGSYLMSIATVDENGPWVSDVVYVNDDDFNIYWLSQESTRHSNAILKNPKVAATITLSNVGGTPNIGLQIQGTAEKVNGNIFDMAVKHRLKRHKLPPSKEDVFLDPGEFWYKIIPTKIEIIYEPLWKFEKKELKLR